MARPQVFRPVECGSAKRLAPAWPVVACLCLALALFGLLALGSQTAGATTLRQAMAEAYRRNPRLDAERARLRATDEEVPRARAGWRPVISGSSDFGYSSVKTKPPTSSSGKTNSWGYSVNLTQPIFNGFRTVNGVRQAEATVRAGRENLRLVEQQVLLQAVTAYADVLRDEALVRLRRHNVAVLTEELTAARARRKVREITRTDVAQSQARRARAVSQLDAAKANLKASRAFYKQIVGRKPSRLKRASWRSKLIPSSLRQALGIAEREHPNVISAKYREQAARAGVDKIRGELLPDLRLEASYNRRFDGTASISEEEETRITGRVTVPFYKGGEVYSRVRQAKHTHVSRLQEIEQARQEVEAGITAAWSQLQAARSRLNSDHVQLAAARTALEGVRAEEKVGQRTIIELLNAQQELLDAGVAVEVTRRDLIVAAYTMIAAMGRLNAQRLALMQEVYDSEEHYGEVRDKWIGLSITDTADEPMIDRQQRNDLGRHGDVAQGRRRRASRQKQIKAALRDKPRGHRRSPAAPVAKAAKPAEAASDDLTAKVMRAAQMAARQVLANAAKQRRARSDATLVFPATVPLPERPRRRSNMPPQDVARPLASNNHGRMRQGIIRLAVRPALRGPSKQKPSPRPAITGAGRPAAGKTLMSKTLSMPKTLKPGPKTARQYTSVVTNSIARQDQLAVEANDGSLGLRGAMVNGGPQERQSLRRRSANAPDLALHHGGAAVAVIRGARID